VRRLDEAETTLQLADEEVTALGHTTYAGGPAIFRARLRTRQGRFDDAIAEAQAGLSAATRRVCNAYDLLGYAVLAIAAVRRGDLDDAARYAKRCEAVHGRAGARRTECAGPTGPSSSSWSTAESQREVEPGVERLDRPAPARGAPMTRMTAQSAQRIPYVAPLPPPMHGLTPLGVPGGVRQVTAAYGGDREHWYPGRS